MSTTSSRQSPFCTKSRTGRSQRSCRDLIVHNRSWKRSRDIVTSDRERRNCVSDDSIGENDREGKGRIVNRVRGDFVQSMIRNVLVKDDIARVEKVIGGERAHTVSPTTWRVPHEEAFTGLSTKLGL
jgi:hypothetical protein